MTVREIYVEMLNVLNDTERKFSNVELQEAIEGRIQKLDEQNAKRRAAERKPSAKQLAAREYDAKLMESIGEILTDEFQLRTVFAEASVHGILQARILEWVAIPFSRGSS